MDYYKDNFTINSSFYFFFYNSILNFLYDIGLLVGKKIRPLIMSGLIFFHFFHTIMDQIILKKKGILMENENICYLQPQ